MFSSFFIKTINYETMEGFFFQSLLTSKETDNEFVSVVLGRGKGTSWQVKHEKCVIFITTAGFI